MKKLLCLAVFAAAFLPFAFYLPFNPTVKSYLAEKEKESQKALMEQLAYQRELHRRCGDFYYKYPPPLSSCKDPDDNRDGFHPAESRDETGYINPRDVLHFKGQYIIATQITLRHEPDKKSGTTLLVTRKSRGMLFSTETNLGKLKVTEFKGPISDAALQHYAPLRQVPKVTPMR